MAVASANSKKTIHQVTMLNIFKIIIICDFVFCTEEVSLEMVLSFFTGADDIPPLGFPHDPQLNFSPTSPYPTASTCAIELTLPMMYNISTQFEEKLKQAFILHGGFGLS